MRVIVHNDDFGLAYGFTEAAKECFQSGVTRSVSIRTNGTAYNYAKRLVKGPLKTVGLGLHLNLTDGVTSTKALADPQGKYRYTFFVYLLLLLLPTKKLLASIEIDLERQIKVAQGSGLKIDHVDSEKHVHMIPGIFNIVCKLCKKFKIPSIRVVHEPYYLVGSISDDILPFINLNIIKFLLLNTLAKLNIKRLSASGLKTTDAFYGILHTNNMNSRAIKAAIENAKKNTFNTVEISAHPAIHNDPRDNIFTSSAIKHYVHLNNREIERCALLDKKTKRLLCRKGIKLSTYKCL